MKMRILILTAILASAALVAASSAEAKTNKPLRGTRVAIADRVPTFDTRPSCADAASEMSVTRHRCDLPAERATGTRCSRVAMAELPVADKRSCVAETNVGGFPSYVQVLVCLELARDARTMKAD